MTPEEVIVEALQSSEHLRSASAGGPPVDSPEWAMIRANVILSALEEAGYELVWA